MPKEILKGIPGGITNGLPGKNPEDILHRILEIFSEAISEENPRGINQGAKKKTLKWITREIDERISGKMSEEILDRISGKISEEIPGGISEKIPQGISGGILNENCKVTPGEIIE